MDSQVKVLEMLIDTGLLSKRNSPNFSMSNMNNVFSENVFKNTSIRKKIRLMIKAGVYNMNKPGVLDVIRGDWYSSPSAKSPEKILREERMLKNKANKAIKASTHQLHSKQASLKKSAKIPKKVGKAKTHETKKKYMKEMFAKKSVIPVPKP